MKKIIILSILTLTVLSIATVVIINIKPQMHKTIMMEQIIYKRVK